MTDDRGPPTLLFWTALALLAMMLAWLVLRSAGALTH